MGRILTSIHISVLLANIASLDTQHSKEINISVIDWEFTQLGLRAHDLGQMIGDLCERKYFNHVDSAIWTIEGFMQGYGPISDEMAFRIAIHAGVHLICWYNRGPSTGPRWSCLGRIADLMKIGRDFIVKGWEKDRYWFEDSWLAPLFTERGR
jgi:hypothetical protein